MAAAALAVGQAAQHQLPSVGALAQLVTRCRFGAYAANEPYPVQAHFALEHALGAHLPVCSWFVAFGQPWPADAAATLAGKTGYAILIAWELHGIVFDDLIAGRYDDYIWHFVNAAAAYPGQVVLRPMHESNGNWYDWAPASGRRYCRDPQQWLRGWRHLITIGRRAAGTNVKFLWCVNNTDAPGIRMEQLWPGAEWTDYVGADAYDWSGSGTFDAIFADVYGRLTALDASSDIWAAEVGVKGQRGGAARFYRSVYGSRGYERLRTLCWFSRGPFALTGNAAAAQVHRVQLRRAPLALPSAGRTTGGTP